jgi:ABC-type proline/glycine betaine transport system ATPase subunit
MDVTRSTLERRILSVLNGTPPRVPVLIGGCGCGRTTLLRSLQHRVGASSCQYIDVERTATTPERFLRAILGA